MAVGRTRAADRLDSRVDALLRLDVGKSAQAFEFIGRVSFSMARIVWHIRIGALYFQQALKMRMEYRADFLVECLASLLQQASGLLMLKFLLNNFHALKEWNQNEVFFIYGFSLIPMAFF